MTKNGVIITRLGTKKELRVYGYGPYEVLVNSQSKKTCRTEQDAIEWAMRTYTNTESYIRIEWID